MQEESFLQGEGELGGLIRNMDWEQTPLGNPSTWPQSLKTAVRIILTSRQPMFVWWGKELINIYNDAYKSIVGGKHPHALGQPAFEVWKEIWHEVEPRVKQCLEENIGTYDEALLLLMQRNGYTEETYYTFSYSPIPGEDGTPQGIICANTDDTSRITGERQMKTLRELARNVADVKSNQEIYQKSLLALQSNPRDFPFITLYEINDDGTEMTLVGKTPDDLSEYMAPPFIPFKKESDFRNELNDAVMSGKMQIVDNIVERFGPVASPFWEMPSKQALLIPILQSNRKHPFALLGVGLNPYRLVDADYLDFFNLVSDQIATALTNVYALRREQKRAEALAEIDKAKTIFFSNISHEFRTPLTLMLGPIEEMLNDPLANYSKQEQSNLEITHRNALRLLRLVNSLLDFSRIEAGRVQAQFRGVCLGQYTSELASSFRSLFEMAGLDFEIVANVRSAAYVDVEMWEKIMLNLLSNAYKYTLSGKVTVAVTEENESILVKIADTGIGIPLLEMPKLFDRFHRVKNAAGRSFEGSGIGLSLVKELVKLNHGTIFGESEEGKGTTFTIVMPVGKEHLSESEIVQSDVDLDLRPTFIPDEILASVSENTTDAADVSAKKSATILVVDDNADMRDYICKLLESEFEVVSANNGAQALERIDENLPDLIVSDIMMPVLDGIGMMKAIKSDEKKQHIPIILLSARAGEEAKIEGYELGADDYLVKPFSSKELFARIRSQLRMAGTRDHVEKQLRNVFKQAPVAIALLKGPELVVEIANPQILSIWGKTAEQVLKKPLLQGLPEVIGQGFPELLKGVYESGIAYVADEMPLDLIRSGERQRIFVKFVYEPLRDDNGNTTGILVVADDITESVEARLDIEASEIRHKLAMEAARMGSFEWVFDQEDFIYSERLAEIFGYEDKRGFRQSDFIDMIHPDDLASRNTAVADAMINGTLFYEARILWKDGTVHWIRLNGKVVNNLDGIPSKMFGTVLDITDEKFQTNILEQKVADRTRSLAEKNQELKISEERYQRMTDEVQDYAILLLDTDGTVLNWNKGAEKIKGYSEDEIVGQSFTKFYLPEDQRDQLPQRLINEAKQNGRATNEGYRIRKDGTVFWGSISITALHDSNDNVIGFSKVTRDLTERKIAEDKMRQYNAELEFQNRELEQFAYIASHDLQEPLRKIQMFSGMLEQNLDDAESVQKYFGKINSSAERMSELIRAVLNYSRLSKADEHFVSVDLNEILRHVLTDFELLIEEKKAVINIDKLPVIHGIPLQMNQLFSNLIGNSLKFNENQPVLAVKCRSLSVSEIPFETNLEESKRYVELVFSDNGIGFEQKYAAQIFTIFQRLNQRTAFTGTGIGLALCKRIVENHKGFISAKSEEGEGASFYVYLPV